MLKKSVIVSNFLIRNAGFSSGGSELKIQNISENHCTPLWKKNTSEHMGFQGRTFLSFDLQGVVRNSRKNILSFGFNVL